MKALWRRAPVVIVPLMGLGAYYGWVVGTGGAVPRGADPTPPRLWGDQRMASPLVARRRPPGAAMLGGDAVRNANAPLPASLRDTDVDGGLAVDAHGDFRATADARVFFDYFLSVSGEEPPETTRGRVEAAIVARLPPSAVGGALDLFDRYLLYRARARDLQDEGWDAADIGVRFDRIHALRRAVLGAAAAEALFGEEEARDRVAIAQRGIATDPTLSAAERAQHLAALEAELPPPLREARAAVMAPLELQRDEAALRASGGSAEEVRALREARFGQAAADRLAQLDAQRAQWRARLDQYRQARAALEADTHLSSEQRTQAVETLLNSRFAPEERLRVEALERIQTAGEPGDALD